MAKLLLKFLQLIAQSGSNLKLEILSSQVHLLSQLINQTGQIVLCGSRQTSSCRQIHLACST